MNSRAEAGGVRGGISLETIQNLCVMAICLWPLSPPLAFNFGVRLLAMTALILWLAIELTRSRGVFAASTTPTLLLTLFVFYTVILEFTTEGTSGLVSGLQLYIMLFFLLVQQSRRRNPGSLTNVFWAITALNIVWMTSTYLFLSTVDPRAMRTIVRSTEEARDYAEQGVGGLAMAYNSALMLPVFLALSLKPKAIGALVPAGSRWLKSSAIAAVWYLTFLCVVIILSSQFSLVVITGFLSSAMVLVLWKITPYRIILALLIFLVVIFFGDALLIEFLTAVKPFTYGTNYALKVDDLLLSLEFGSATGTAEDRLERYERSISLFLDNPVLGVLSYADIGKHSTLLDHYARWGLFIGSILFYLVIFLPVRILRHTRGVSGLEGAAIGGLVATLAVLGLNKGVAATGTVLYLIYPVIFWAIGQGSRLAATGREQHA